MLQASTLQFLQQLHQHNYKEWFDQHRPAYETAKEDFLQLVQDLIAAHGKKDPDIAPLVARECLLRINRDIRFSKDKTPYKSHLGANFTAGGRKSLLAGYYLHIQPGNQSFVAGGYWMPPPDLLKKIRQEIDYCYEEFAAIVQGKKFISQLQGLERSADFVLSRPPKGYDELNPAIEYLKLKCYVASCPLSDADLKSKDLKKKILQGFEALHPLLHFLNRAIA